MKKVFYTLIFLVLGCISSMAANILKIAGEDGANIQILPGTENQLQVVLDNDDPVSSLQFDVTLPKGLNFVEGSLKKVVDRITRTSHSVLAVQQPSGAYRFGVLTTSSSMATSAIKGNTGAILTFSVKADANYDGGSIKIDKIMGSNGVDATKEPIPLPMEEQLIKAAICPGHAGLEAAEITLTPGKSGVLNVTLANYVPLVGLQAKVTLPEGLRFVEGKDGDIVDYTTRLSDNVSAKIENIEGNTYKLLISSVANDEFKETEGVLFGLNVAADNTFKGGDVVISDIKVASASGNGYDVTDVLSCNIKYLSDPTADGKWNISDINEIILVLSGSSKNPAADVNADGKVNIQDINEVVNKLGNK